MIASDATNRRIHASVQNRLNPFFREALTRLGVGRQSELVLAVAAWQDFGIFELRELLEALQSMLNGDFSVRLPGHWTGLQGKIADTFNEIVASEIKRAGEVVGKQGKTSQRVRFDRSTCSLASD